MMDEAYNESATLYIYIILYIIHIYNCYVFINTNINIIYMTSQKDRVRPWVPGFSADAIPLNQKWPVGYLEPWCSVLQPAGPQQAGDKPLCLRSPRTPVWPHASTPHFFWLCGASFWPTCCWLIKDCHVGAPLNLSQTDLSVTDCKILRNANFHIHFPPWSEANKKRKEKEGGRVQTKTTTG